ncbi:myb domain-containing protein [Reticulomyxa filosa]|uniref:Myb domain-containing protein n=1 Tax=Reticulomyxa filosa TaxID=46433 RepID=X6LN96_RETFI|nr:myb domain-containing protein [Reticulomyxa filosa]|eukprot:ETO03368.1 myb domain-containing protein [Reticulomyxa filosa]
MKKKKSHSKALHAIHFSSHWLLYFLFCRDLLQSLSSMHSLLYMFLTFLIWYSELLSILNSKLIVINKIRIQKWIIEFRYQRSAKPDNKKKPFGLGIKAYNSNMGCVAAAEEKPEETSEKASEKKKTSQTAKDSSSTKEKQKKEHQPRPKRDHQQHQTQTQKQKQLQVQMEMEIQHQKQGQAQVQVQTQSQVQHGNQEMELPVRHKTKEKKSKATPNKQKSWDHDDEENEEEEDDSSENSAKKKWNPRSSNVYTGKISERELKISPEEGERRKSAWEDSDESGSEENDEVAATYNNNGNNNNNAADYHHDAHSTDHDKFNKEKRPTLSQNRETRLTVALGPHVDAPVHCVSEMKTYRNQLVAYFSYSQISTILLLPFLEKKQLHFILNNQERYNKN